ncbi:MAG: NUDIX domain-containing protein, partial [Lachnospiraceae bacterium]|nr:NUDIX domain-containing protein [Lachnospiraceae bacterium]
MEYKMKDHNVAEKHPAEKAIFMNMCMLCDGDMVLALDKTGSNYSGTTFPGGHVEAGETFSEAVIR